MALDANSWDEAERRRHQFRDWLLRVWEWAADNRPRSCNDIAGLIAHADELDYPLWKMAERLKLIGDGALADILRQECGMPVVGDAATGWERQINFAPVIKLEKDVWDRIYTQLGWANRDSDTRMGVPSFWLWSNQGNVIRFVVKEAVLEKEIEDARGQGTPGAEEAANS